MGMHRLFLSSGRSADEKGGWSPERVHHGPWPDELGHPSHRFHR